MTLCDQVSPLGVATLWFGGSTNIATSRKSQFLITAEGWLVAGAIVCGRLSAQDRSCDVNLFSRLLICALLHTKGSQ
jgi:hypothetical protein